MTQYLLLSDLTQTGPALGSQQGGTYVHADGTRYYVKISKTDTHARNEILASRLYRLAGIDTPELLQVADGNGVLVGTASVWMDGAQQDLNTRLAASRVGSKADRDYIAQIQKGFAVDVWLANWDVAGLVFDNVVSVNGRAVRVDTGGCLLMRAMGAPKGNLFNDSASEWSTLRNAGMAPQAFHLFSSMTAQQLYDSALIVAGISPAQIREAVESVGFDGLTEQHVIQTLKARRNVIVTEAAAVIA